jgi:Smg protein
MNENVVDILIYLYENYTDSDQRQPSSQAELKNELMHVGFPETEIRRTFKWLDGLAAQQPAHGSSPNTTQSFRVFTDKERLRLDAGCRGLLLFLERHGILDQASRELVIERTIALNDPHIGIEELRWVVLMVLMNQPGQEGALTQMEDLIYNEQPRFVH